MGSYSTTPDEGDLPFETGPKLPPPVLRWGRVGGVRSTTEKEPGLEREGILSILLVRDAGGLSPVKGEGEDERESSRVTLCPSR